MYEETLGKKIGFFQDPALDFIEFVPACSTHSKPLAVEEHNRAIVSSLAVDFSHVVKIHNYRTMDSDKSDGIELAAQFGNRLPQHERAPLHVKATVVICRFDPLDRLSLH
jgi:hypothetical protein